MKQHLLFFSLLFCFGLSAQETITSSIMYDEVQRNYILYVPDSYTGDEQVPLVFNFHGFGSNATEQMNYGDFRSIADTAGFIIVHPEGLLFNGTTHWNVGGFTTGSTVDDVGFTSALIDSLSSEYMINPDEIYSTGMSNGGYMSFLLACQLNDRIAAIASVTGSMSPQTFNDCNPQHPTAVMQIHGTADPTVPYNGAIWTQSIDNVRDYWRNFNNGPAEDQEISVPDTDMTDGSTVTHFINDSGDREVRVEHYQIQGGLHTWPGSFFRFPGTNYDINASAVVWDFFSEFDINGKKGLPVANEELEYQNFQIYPNPVESNLTIHSADLKDQNYSIHTLSGERLLQGVVVPGSNQIDFSELINGFYIMRVGTTIHKIIKE